MKTPVFCWEVEWADGTRTVVGSARGHRDALRRAVVDARRADYRVVRRRTTAAPYVYGLVSWRKAGGLRDVDVEVCGPLHGVWDRVPRRHGHSLGAGRGRAARGPAGVSGGRARRATAAMVGVVALPTAARGRGLKAPAVRFLAPSGGELRLSLAGGSTKWPGAVQVKVDAQWVGRVLPDGTVAGPLAQDAPLRAALAAIAADPARAATQYGALMGRCSFCRLPLTDAGSVAVGYGPACAKHWGLPHARVGTPPLTAMPEAAA